MDLDKLLYDDGDGVFAKLRRGDYEKDESQLDLVIFGRNGGYYEKS